MDFALTDEQEMVVDTVRAFVDKELVPHEEEVERLGELHVAKRAAPHVMRVGRARSS